jgi:hypothetical protein
VCDKTLNRNIMWQIDGLRGYRPGFHSRKGNRFFSTALRLSFEPSEPRIQRLLTSTSSQLKRLRREADRSPLSRADVKNVNSPH